MPAFSTSNHDFGGVHIGELTDGPVHWSPPIKNASFVGEVFSSVMA